ncbi:tetratricopeptide repeat protein [Sphingomonas sp. NPDC019816]|uniref:tetratricopeptide repeat protein n=1 Tax=Sphingomonas sp. NPDC019816 TaxID=3390679 RepID=UPI003D074CDB
MSEGEVRKGRYRGRDRRASQPYPMMRRKRRIWQRRSVRTRIRLIATLAVIAVGMAGLAYLLRSGEPPVHPAAALRQATAALQAGNYHAAHDQARRAAIAAPRSRAAQMMLARTSLLIEEGVTAEAALDRALADGVPVSQTLAMRAEARLIQGNVADAQEAVARMPPTPDAEMIRIMAKVRAAQNMGGGRLRAVLDRLAAAYPGDAAVWTDLGRSRFAAGDVTGATEAAGRATALAPADPRALTLQGEIVRARYGLTAGLPWFRAALARDPYYHPALIQYAGTLGDLGRASDALAATRTALVSRPGSPEAFYLQAVIAARAGQYPLARQLLELTGGNLNSRPAVVLLDGAVAFAQGQRQRAARVWGRLLAMQPMNIGARRLLAAAQIFTGDRAAALATLRPILARADADGYALRLAVMASAGGEGKAALIDRAASGVRGPSTIFRPDRPLAELTEDAADAPTDPTYVLGVVRALARKGDWSGALAKTQALVRATPGAPAAQMAYGDIQSLAGRSADALASYDRAANLTFDEPAMLRLIDGYMRTAKPRDAAVALGLYVSQNPQSVPARRLLGQWQLASGEWDEAIETLEGLRTQLGPRDVALLRDLALAYAGSGDGVVARRYGEAAYRLAPMNASVADAYGVALAAAGETEGARQLFDKALSLSPGNPVVIAHRDAL